MNSADNSVLADDKDTPRAALGFDSLGLTIIALAWRNLWRNRRRTWLTVAGIAFAVWFLIFARAMQEGSFDVMIDNGAKLLPGHLQVQHPAYQDDPRVENVFDAARDLQALQARSEVQFVSPRGQGFALVSAGDRSFGAQIVGVDFATERRWSGLLPMIVKGTYPDAPGQALIGATLARNLGLDVGDELVVLGTAKHGGIAALATIVTGIYDASQPELNRGLVKVHIDDFRDAWNLAPDEAHAVVAILDSAASGTQLARELDTASAVLPWQELMPETQQMKDMKAVSTEVMFIVMTIIIGFSVINTFMMVVFERTAEFGVLTAIGMRAGLIRAQLQIEGLFLAALGAAIGFALAGLLVTVIGDRGLPIPVPADMQDYYARFNMGTRIYPAFQWPALYTASAVMVIGLQLAAFIPGLRLRNMQPVEALRQET